MYQKMGCSQLICKIGMTCQNVQIPRVNKLWSTTNDKYISQTIEKGLQL